MTITLRSTLPLLLAATASAAPLLAQAQGAEIYGQLHVSVDHLDSDVPGDDAAPNVSSNASRIGFRGKHELDSRLSVVWQAEATADVVNAGNLVVDRDTFLGLTGDWGLLRVGQFDTPLKTLRNRIDLFGNQVGDARNIVHADGLDRRLKNSLHYRTPSFGGLTGNLQYSTNTAGGGTQDDEAYAYSLSLEYTGKRFWVGVAHDDNKSNDESAVRVAGYVDVADFRFTGLYQQTDKDPAPGATGIAQFDTTAYGAGIRYTLNEKIALKTQYYVLEIDNPTDDEINQVAVGVDYSYAKALKFYANYAVTDNEGTLVARTPYNVSRSSTTGAGEKPSGFSVGAIYSF